MGKFAYEVIAVAKSTTSCGQCLRSIIEQAWRSDAVGANIASLCCAVTVRVWRSLRASIVSSDSAWISLADVGWCRGAFVSVGDNSTGVSLSSGLLDSGSPGGGSGLDLLRTRPEESKRLLVLSQHSLGVRSNICWWPGTASVAGIQTLCSKGRQSGGACDAPS